MERLWVCVDNSCEGGVIWTYDQLAKRGAPQCPDCAGDTYLTDGRLEEVVRRLSKRVRL